MGRKIVSLICVSLMILLQSCSKSADPRDLIAKDPLAVVYLKSFKDFESTLSPQMIMMASMAKGALTGVDDTKPVVLVLTGLEPVSAYVVFPMKDIADKDSLLTAMSTSMKEGAEVKGTNLLVPLAGSLPSSFAPYDKLQSSSIIHAIADVDQIEKKHGKYIRSKIIESFQSISALGVPASEKELFDSMGDFYADFLDSYMKESNYFNIEYRKSQFPMITGLWNFKKGSKMAEAANRLGKKNLPEIPELKSMPVYYSSTLSWDDVEPLFGGSAESIGKLYKALGMELDFKEVISDLKEVGNIDMVMGMNMDILNNNMSMKSVVRGDNNGALKKMVYNMLAKMSTAADNNLMKISKKDFQFRGNDVYGYDEVGNGLTGGAVPGTPPIPATKINALIAADDNGAYYGMDKEDLEKVANYKFQKSSEKGYFMMSMDYGNMMPATPGMPPMDFILKVFATGGEDSFLMKMTFE